MVIKLTIILILLLLLLLLYYAFRLRGSWQSYQWNLNSELHKLMISIQTAHAKLSSQDENSREHVLRSQMIIKWN